MVGRFIASVCVVAIYSIFGAVYSPVATLLTGQAAGWQFENSDAVYLQSVYTFSAFQGFGAFTTGVMLLALLFIWLWPAREAIKKITAAMAITTLVFFGISDAHAFFEKTDKIEAYTILPNQSAFWIPDVGANQTSQVQLDSEAYYNANRVAVKRMVIPHAKLPNSGGWGAWDYYVPIGRLLIVDRTPYSREWVDAHDRGTAKQKEGFPCQTKEGLNVTAEEAFASAENMLRDLGYQMLVMH